MYVNTLITLQENLPTYALTGQHIMGHVTLMSPGWIKCYIQNLKAPTNDSKYTFFIFSKGKQKGIRLGELSKQKETKWLVDENNIEDSGLTLNDIDGICVVSENADTGADAVAMGFENGRYIIMPIIDSILKKLNAKKESKTEETNTVKEVKKASQETVKQETPQTKAEEETIIPSAKIAEELKKVEDAEPGPVIETSEDNKDTDSAKTLAEKEADELLELEMIAAALEDTDTSQTEATQNADRAEEVVIAEEIEEAPAINEVTELEVEQEVEPEVEQEAEQEVEPETNEKTQTKKEKKGITPEDLLRVIAQVNNDPELKDKITAFGKQLKVISQFATRNNKTQDDVENRSEDAQAIETEQEVVETPQNSNPLAQPLELIEKLLGQEIEPKETPKKPIHTTDTSPRSALKFIKNNMKKEHKFSKSKEPKNSRTNSLNTIEKKIEDIQLRREQEINDTQQ